VRRCLAGATLGADGFYFLVDLIRGHLRNAGFRHLIGE
jgi:hypothetical protein